MVGVEALLQSFLGLTVSFPDTPWNLENGQWTINLWFSKKNNSAVMACRYLPIYVSVNVVSKKSKSDFTKKTSISDSSSFKSPNHVPSRMHAPPSAGSLWVGPFNNQKTKLSQAWKIQTATRGSCRNVRKLGTHIFHWMGPQGKGWRLRGEFKLIFHFLFKQWNWKLALSSQVFGTFVELQVCACLWTERSWQSRCQGWSSATQTSKSRSVFSALYLWSNPL